MIAMALTVESIPAAFAAAEASPVGSSPGGGKLGAGGSPAFDSLQTANAGQQAAQDPPGYGCY